MCRNHDRGNGLCELVEDTPFTEKVLMAFEKEMGVKILLINLRKVRAQATWLFFIH
jgi:hypothetical protein